MDTHARYMFDAVFACSDNTLAAAEEMPRHNDFALGAARDAAYQQGLVDGHNQAETDNTKKQNELISRLLEQIQVANQNMIQFQDKVESEATHLALQTALALAPALIAREPEGELMALFSECIAQQGKLPHLVIHVPAGVAENLRQSLEAVCANLGTNVEFRLAVDETMMEGDCRLAWATGEISRNRQHLEEQISAILARRYPAPETNPVPETQHIGNTDDTPVAGSETGPVIEGETS